MNKIERLIEASFSVFDQYSEKKWASSSVLLDIPLKLKQVLFLSNDCTYERSRSLFIMACLLKDVSWLVV